MNDYYDDPYSFNYTTQVKGGNISSNRNDDNVFQSPNKGKGFNVFNPNKLKNNSNETKTSENVRSGFNEKSNRSQEGNIDELQGTIDLDKNSYEKPKENKNTEYDSEEEIPLLEGIF